MWLLVLDVGIGGRCVARVRAEEMTDILYVLVGVCFVRVRNDGVQDV